jgi:hypothetical protein
MRNLAVAVLASYLAACAMPTALRPGDLSPMVARTAPDQRQQLWNRAVQVLLDDGYVPQVLNQDAAYISAKRRDDSGDTDVLHGTFAIVTISPDGALRVEVGGAGVYHSTEQLARDLQREQTRIIAEITGAPPG